MRSEDVFAAAKTIRNRFLLCRVASVSAQRLQTSPRPYAESINQSLKLIAGVPPAFENAGATGEIRMSLDSQFLGPVPPKVKSVHADSIFEPLILDTIAAG
jgi:hypothetical protein